MGDKYTSIPHFTALHFTAFFYILKAYGNFVSSLSAPCFQQHLFTSHLCHILIILQNLKLIIIYLSG